MAVVGSDPGDPPGVADSLGEEAQVLVDLHGVVDLQDLILLVLEQSQSVTEHHLQHTFLCQPMADLIPRDPGDLCTLLPSYKKASHRGNRMSLGRLSTKTDRNQLKVTRDTSMAWRSK